MKVKELIQELSNFDPELEVGYEHLYIDYARQQEGEQLVDLGGLRPGHISRWVPLDEREPDDDKPFIIALPEEINEPKGKWNYYMGENMYMLHMGLGTAAKQGGRWMYIEPTLEDGWARQGATREQIEHLLKADGYEC